MVAVPVCQQFIFDIFGRIAELIYTVFHGLKGFEISGIEYNQPVTGVDHMYGGLICSYKRYSFKYPERLNEPEPRMSDIKLFFGVHIFLLPLLNQIIVVTTSFYQSLRSMSILLSELFQSAEYF